MRVFYPKRLVALSFLLMMSLAIPAQSAIDHRDGNWWRLQTGENKGAYMIGFLDGLDLGYRFSYWGSVYQDGKQDWAKARPVGHSFSQYVNKYLTDVSNVQIADGLDTFYEDYRNRKLIIADAVWIVLNAISGTIADPT